MKDPIEHYWMLYSKKIQGNPESWDLYLSQACAAIKFSISESSKLSLFFLMYNPDNILPVTNILSADRCMQEKMHVS